MKQDSQLAKSLMHIILISVIALSVCLSCNNCGESVKIGEYLLMDKSISDWAPYEDMSELTFRDLDGNELIFTQTEFNTHISLVPLNETCYKSYYDTSVEYVETESWDIKYRAGEHTWDISLFVTEEAVLSIDKFYDRVTYNYYGPNIGGWIDLVANDRQNSISPDILLQPEFVYSEEIEINGQYYKDVWSYNIENPTEVFTPLLYVKQGVGILAFIDDDGTLWNIVN